MKRLLATLLSLSLILVSCSPSQSSETPPANTETALPSPTTPPDLMDTPWEDRSIFQKGLIQSQQAVLNELDSASIYHLEFELAENMNHITGMEEVRYTNAETVPLNEIRFRLFPNILGGAMTISNVTIDGQPAKPTYELGDSLMIVPLPKSLEPSHSVVLAMEYAVTIPLGVDLNYGVLAYYEDVLALAHAYPMICVYDDEGWNAEIPPQSGDVTYGDAAFYIVRVTAPAGVTLVTSGREISHDEAGQTQVLTVASGPARDFYLAASSQYEVVTEQAGEVTIRSFADKEAEAGSRFAVQTALNAIRVFGERYTPYPYTELDIVATPTQALGIEYPGMIAITSWIYDQQQERANILMESTVAHEVGHQWFYSLVGDDQLDDPWLDESLTQFATLQYYADLYGPGGEQGFRSSLESRWARVGNAEIPIGLPVAGYDEAEYGAIVYGRGPLFFVALRDEMGNEAFNDFLKEYTETFSWGIATPEGMRSLAEKHCSCDLQAIFDRWVYP